MRTWRAAFIAVVVLVTGTVVTASAVAPVGQVTPTPVAGGQALDARHPVLTFGGEMPNPTPLPMVSNPDPTVCAVDCQQWSLKVATRSPFLVSLHNGTASVDDGFNLYVYDPAGNQVAAGAGIGANGQAIAVTPTSAGT